MVLNNILNNIFTSPSIIAVLRVLNMRKAGVTGREIARISGMSHRSALKALENLEGINLVKKLIAGKSYLFTINRNHFLYKNLVNALFKVENEYLSRISEHIHNISGSFCESIIIYGSVARGDESPESDFDVCFVYKNDPQKIEQTITILRSDLNNIYGITLAPFIISEAEFRKRADSGKPPVNNIIKEGKIIYGKQIRGLINGQKGSKKKG